MPIKPSQYKILQPFEAWVQQTLPAIYDDSLSYTDLLAKMLYYINTLAENNTTLSNDVTNAINYINNYLGSDEFTDQVRKKLDEMASDGTLSRLIQPLFDEYKTQIDDDVKNFKNQTNQAIATQNNSISSIQSQQNTLKERMDTFTQLPSGSTTGDAELQDIRVGANGLTYNTAGDAVRGQYRELDEKMDSNLYELGCLTNNQFNLNNYISSSGKFVSDPAWRCTGFLSLENINYLIINNTFNQTAGLTIAFYTENNEDSFLYGELLPNLTSQKIIIPKQNAKYFAICNRINNDIYAYLSYKYIGKINIKNTLNDVIDECTFSTDLLNIDESGYIYQTKELPTLHNNFLWLKNNFSNIVNFEMKANIKNIKQTIRTSFKLYGDKIFTISLEKDNNNKFAATCFDEDINTLLGFTKVNDIDFVTKEYSLRFNKIGNSILIYIDNVVAFVFSNYIINKIKKVGFNFRGSGIINYYSKEYKINNFDKKFAHISFDDQIECLHDLSTKTYSSIFENNVFSKLKALHDKYGCVFTLELFMQNSSADTEPSFKLSSMTNKYKKEFTENSHWLKFGYHGPDYTTYLSNMSTEDLITSVKNMYTEIERFASYANIDKTPRLSMFDCTKNQALELRKQNLINGLLTADDARSSNVGLTSGENYIMHNYDKYTDFKNKITYFRSEERLDVSDYPTQDDVINNMNAKFNNVNNKNIFIIFGHQLTDELYNRLQLVCEWLFDKNFIYEYPMNNVDY